MMPLIISYNNGILLGILHRKIMYLQMGERQQLPIFLPKEHRIAATLCSGIYAGNNN
jgi:hypothetical protein